MAFVLIEAAVDAVKLELETNMAAKLTALDTEYADFALASIQQYYIAEISEIPEQPAILILADRTEIEREADNYIRGSHYLTIAIIATDQDAEQLRRRLYRYVRAIVELLREARSSAGWEYVIVFDTLDFGPIYTNESSFMQDARVLLHLNKTDT